MMAPDDGPDFGPETERETDSLSKGWVLLDNLELFRSELSGFMQDRVRDTDLANVMQQRTISDHGAEMPRQAQGD